MFARLRSFLTTLIQRERFEDSLDEEMRFHLDAQTEGSAPGSHGRKRRAARECSSAASKP